MPTIYPKNRNIHRPSHLYYDETFYFLTASTLKEKHLVNTDFKKDVFTKALNKTIKFYGFLLYGWVILSNHYHLLLKVASGKDIPKFFRKFHSEVAIALNKIDQTPSRQVFYQYWDECLREDDNQEKDFYTWINYIHINPPKHGEIKVKPNSLQVGKEEIIIPKENTDDLIFALKHYRYSSFNSYLKRYGEEWLRECFENHPIRVLKYDGF